MMFSRFFVAFIISLCFLNAWSQSSVIEIKKSNNKFQFYKNGKPYYIKGAGAKSNFKTIVESGGNSIRLWSTNKSSLLDSAQKYGLSVCQGIWIAQERNGFDYNDDYNVKGQVELIKKEILRVKDHPSIILWGIGNEVDLKYSNFRVWETIEEIAKFIKKVDPKHPTMTVIAGLDPAKVFMIKKYCPSIDILGINVYGAIENAPINIRRFGWEKPYIVTEWGVNGPFEARVNDWGAKIEPTNGFKAKQRLRRYQEIIEKDTGMCLGSYCFLWGQKQESTSTWHGMYLSNGNPTEAVDVMHYCWKGYWPEKRAPSIQEIFLNGESWKANH
ncbi:MAG: glycoside hydrolase family 2 TIM barrel-domain containing protein, partial [Bacteroidota bacterium]|nr:glycoside hydrolase family 2 TIM barrel-domain containing protein [Bacteroidota bacterium]